jgi:pyrroloquinoline-quinone synthase
VLDHANTLEKQDAAAAALTFKTEVLWAQLDALHFAYVTPGLDAAGRLGWARRRDWRSRRGGAMTEETVAISPAP